jgi:hypothetical protein
MVSLAQMQAKPYIIRFALVFLPVLLLLSLGACRPTDGESQIVTPSLPATAVPRRALAPVEAINIFQVDTFPVEVSVVARGHLPDECTNIDQISQVRHDGTFEITIDSVQYGGSACAETRVPFEESVELDLLGIPAGIYVVDVNGLQGTFKLQRDNIPDDSNAVIGGRVRQDRCEMVEDEEGRELQPSASCVDRGDGTYRGDGIFEADDPGLGGAMVYLGAGICPATGLATTITGADGTFLFSGLKAGDYCLSVTGSEGQNSDLSAEGEGTFPGDGAGQTTVNLLPGGSKLDLEFGWSALLRPEPTVLLPTPAGDCTNKALFIADLTIPDDTLLTAGETFTKTWRLQNLGSCVWDASYSLTPVAGDKMGSSESVPLTTTVPPGELGDLSITLIAPESPGGYRGEWQLMNSEGILFGIGPGSDKPFWVQIVVIGDETAE